MSSEKIEWRKEEKGFSLRKKPQILTIPEQNYFSIAGEGDPNYLIFRKGFNPCILFLMLFG